MNELALFAGAGGGILAGHMLGWRTVCAVERNAYAASILAQRQNDGCLPTFPIWSDVCSFDGRPWCGIVDIVSGGFPCQDISAAGSGLGLDGKRSGLWSEMARIIRDVQPKFVYVENSPMLTSRGLGRVLGDLATMGFDAEWGVVSAADTGAPHLRERIWILANLPGVHAQGQPYRPWKEQSWGGGRWPSEPGLDRVDNGMADRVDRLTAIGNGQVPRVAAAAWHLLHANDNDRS
jgi:DNA (cytosine-5)-methyltransferase 1